MCVNPITLTRTRCGQKSKETVPCGHCPECIKDNQNEFVIRTVEEQKKRGNMWFITLTYAPKSVPVAFDADGELVDEELVPRCKDTLRYRYKDEQSNLSYRTQSLIGNQDIAFDEAYFESCHFEDDMPEDVYEGNVDMPLEVYYGQNDSTWYGEEYAKKDIEKENKYTKEDLLLDKETGEMPVNIMSLDSRDIKNWKKRVRRSIEYHEGRKLDFGYMLCGEYGPRTRRPHYHGILLGLKDEDVMKFKKDWESHYGYTCFKKINSFDVERTAKYVSKYINKQECLNDTYMLNGYSQKPRKLTSIGYGVPTKERDEAIKSDIFRDFPCNEQDNLSNVNGKKVKEIVNRLSNNGLKYHLNGKDYKLPRYYRKRYFYVSYSLGDERKSCPSALYNLVQKAVRDRVQKDFVLKCIEMASHYAMPEDYETYVDVAKRVTMAEKMEREDRAKAIVERDKSTFRKGKF